MEFGDHVTVGFLEVADSADRYCLRWPFDGDYDTTGPPDPLIKTTYFRIRSGEIVTLFVIKNTEPKS